MSKKLEGNGLWESSRMMLPEHKERIRSRRRGLNHKQRPELDVLELERFYRLLAESAETGTLVCVTTFGSLEDEQHIGVVTRIDTIHSRVKLSITEETVQWIEVSELTGVEAMDAGKEE